MDKIKVCKLFGYNELVFGYYLDYLKSCNSDPIEYKLESIDDIKRYILHPTEEYSFISFCKENYAFPFKQEAVEGKRSCSNCAYLLKEINGDDYYCGSDYTSLDNVCFNHFYVVDSYEELLKDTYQR